LTCCRNWR